MWHEAMFGLNAPKPNEGKSPSPSSPCRPSAEQTGWQDYNANEQITPLREYDNRDTIDWFGHGYTDLPPAAGVFLELPAGQDLVGGSSIVSRSPSPS